MNRTDPGTFLLIFIAGILLFFPFLGMAHLFDWDEINFAESAREMLVLGDYSRVRINYEPFWEKPPLFFWMQALSMSLFGVTEYAARFPNAVCGVITLLVIYTIGSRKYDTKFGFLWALAHAGSFLPHFYFKSGIIDPWFNLFIFLGIHYMAAATEQVGGTALRSNTNGIIAGFFVGLAVITKGPVGLLIPLLCFLAILVINRGFRNVHLVDIVGFAVMCFLVSGVWFGYETYQNGPWFLVEFVQYQIRLFSTPDAGHGGPFYYHALVILVGCFPASVYMFPGFLSSYSDGPEQRHYKNWMMALFFTVLILFSIVETKIVHYSSLTYFGVSFFAASYLHKASHRDGLHPILNALFFIIGFIISAVLIVIPYIDKLKPQLYDKVEDPFFLASLDAGPVFSGFEGVIGAVYLFVLLIVVSYINRNEVGKAAMVMFALTAVLLQGILIVYVPKVEKYTQAAEIEFFKSLQGKDCYVTTAGFKSYAHLYYAKVPPAHGAIPNQAELLMGKIDKPVYVVSKIPFAYELGELSKCRLLYEKNGYVFFERLPEAGK